MSVALIRDGVIRPSENDSHVLTTMLPSSCPQNHAANILPLPDGALMCVWFAGTQEGIADISVWGSRLPAGGMQWSDAVKLSHDGTRSEQNPVLFLAPDNVLWLLWTAQISGNQDTAIVRYRKSDDLGQTWGEIATLLDKPGTFIRQPITVLDNGNWLLPVFYCRTQPGEKWVGNDDISAVKISADGGHSWRDVEVPQSLGCVHMNITMLHDGTLVALFRSRWADNIYISHSVDNGESWSVPQATKLLNNNSSIQVTTLASGELALVYNAMSAAGAVAISADGGKSWPWRRNLDEGDGYCMTNNSLEKLNREFSYPSIKQSPDGTLHIAYTWWRQAIKYVRISPEWVKGQAS